MGRRRRGKRRGRLGLVLVLLVLLLAGAYVLAQRAEPPEGASPRPPTTPAATGDVLRVHYVDVGQGDGTIWELPGGQVVVYDCGPPASTADENPMVRYLRDALQRPTGTTLRALVASHGHLDHVGGCEELLATYRFEHVYEAWYEGEDAPESYRRFQREVEAEGAALHTLPALAPGTRLALDGVEATLLWPRAFAPGGWDAVAEASLVVRVVHGATAFCFQGDIEDRQERILAAEQPDARCDVYLVGHHGSRSASDAAWLRVMDPEVAVASYGENGYGHPHPDAVCRIQGAGATLYATMGQGAIVVESDGARVTVASGRPSPPLACPT